MNLADIKDAKLRERIRRADQEQNTRRVGGLATTQPKSTPPATLDRGDAKQTIRSRRLAIRVTLVAFRRRLLDDDNNTASFKFIRDAIAGTLGMDDGDARLEWECQQLKTTGKEGVVVKFDVSC